MQLSKFVIIFVLFLTSSIATIAPEDDFGKGTTTQEFPPDTPDYWKQNAGVADTKEVAEGIKSGAINDFINDVPTERLKENIDLLTTEQLNLLKQEKVKEILNDLKKERWNELNPITLGNILSEASGEKVNINLGSEGIGGRVTSNGFELEKVGELKIGDSLITNGKGVKYAEKTISVKEADSFIHKKIFGTKVKNSQASKNVVRVQEAEIFDAGCLRIEQITDAIIELNERIEVQTTGPGTIREGNTRLEYDSIGQGRITARKDVCNQEYNIQNITANTETNETNETIIANNSAIIEINPKVGIECINYTPTGQFLVNFKNKPNKDFSLKVWKNNHKICQRKIAEQKIQECNECSIIDYVENKILFNGSPSYYRYWIDGTAILSKDLVSTVELEKGRAELFFEKDFLLFAVEISSCKGLCTISPNNYLSIYEVGETFGFKQPHRMLYINPEIKASQSLLTQYRTTYSQAQMEVKEDGVLDYSRDEILVKVLPQQHSMITALTNGLKDRAIKPYEFLLPLAFLLPLLRRKGQVTIFMTFGILILLLVGFVLFFGLVKSAEWETPQTPLQNYITSCLEKTSKATLVRFGAQNNNVFDEKTAKEVLSKSVEQELPLCFNEFKTLKEQGINATECGKPKVQAQVNKEDVLFTLDYCLDEFSNNKITRIPRLGARIGIKLGNILSSARIMTNSKILVNGKKLIDLEELTPLNYYLYPEQDKIKAITMQNKIEEKTNYWFSYTRE